MLTVHVFGEVAKSVSYQERKIDMEKLNDIALVGKVKELLANEEEKKKIKKIAIILLADIGGLVLIGGGIYLFLRLPGRIGQDDDYDLYDDLDNYYDEEEPAAEAAAEAKDFAE